MTEEELFHAALRQPPAERAGFLDRTCAGDPELRQRLRSLLSAHDEPAGLLAQPIVEPAAAEPRPAAVGPGGRIGPYELVQVLGEGGMGTVYLAEQRQPVRRRVALKVLKGDTDSRQVIARFEAERQALCLMHHPNIATVLEAGATDAGRPYFVMELVQGVPITEYCDAHRLTPKQRLELIVPVCHAVQHAHQKGIIHRDLKPSNVLVVAHDGRPVPKVIDFGVAKATGPKLTEHSVCTGIGLIVGTLEYMSPEQAELDQLDVDTRSDIYSLGVLLYELLTGTTPIERERVRAGTVLEVLRRIREDTPPRPSTRLSTAVEPLSVASSRGLEPRALCDAVRGELDWIVMKALEKDRDRRYDSAAALAADVERHLRNEPVLAGPPSNWYRLRKGAERHRVAVVAAGAVLLALLGGLLLAVSAFAVARAQEATALAQARKAQAVITLLQELLGPSDPHEVRGASYPVRRLLDDFDASLAGQLRDEPEVEAAVRRTLGTSYLGLGLAEEAGPHLETALATRRRLFGEEHLLVAESLLDWARYLHLRADYRGAAEYGRQSLALWRKLGGESQETAAALTLCADQERHLGDLAAAEQLQREALGMQRKLFGDAHTEVAESLGNLAMVLKDRGDLAEAERLMRECLAIERRLLGDGHPDVATAENNLALVLLATGEVGEAARLLREALRVKRSVFGEQHPSLVASLHNLAVIARDRGDLAEAEDLLRQVVAMPFDVLDETHPQRALSVHELAAVLRRQGRLDEAERLHREALSIRREVFGPESLPVASSLCDLAVVLQHEGGLAEAERLFREGLAIRRRLLAGDDPDVASNLQNLGTVLRERGQRAEAELVQREALAMWRRLHGPAHPDVASSLTSLALVLGGRGASDEADELHREAVAMNRELLGEQHVATASSLHQFGSFLRRRGALAEAEAILQQALAVRRTLLGERHADTAQSLHQLAHVFEAEDDLARAAHALREVVSIERERGPEHKDLAESLQCLALVLIYARDYAEAEPLQREAVRLWERVRGPRHRHTVAEVRILGLLLIEKGEPAAAELVVRDAVERARQGLAPTDPELFNSVAMLSSTLLAQGKHEEAEPLAREAFEFRAANESGSFGHHLSMSVLGACLLGQGRLDEAAPLLVEAAEKIDPPARSAARKREAVERVVRLYEAKGQEAEARAWRQRLAALGERGGR